jgi:hypothetical protein
MLCFWSFREARWPALVQQGAMVSGAIASKSDVAHRGPVQQGLQGEEGNGPIRFEMSYMAD